MDDIHGTTTMKCHSLFILMLKFQLYECGGVKLRYGGQQAQINVLLDSMMTFDSSTLTAFLRSFFFRIVVAVGGDAKVVYDAINSVTLSSGIREDVVTEN